MRHALGTSHETSHGGAGTQPLETCRCPEMNPNVPSSRGQDAGLLSRFAANVMRPWRRVLRLSPIIFLATVNGEGGSARQSAHAEAVGVESAGWVLVLDQPVKDEQGGILPLEAVIVVAVHNYCGEWVQGFAAGRDHFVPSVADRHRRAEGLRWFELQADGNRAQDCRKLPIVHQSIVHSGSPALRVPQMDSVYNFDEQVGAFQAAEGVFGMRGRPCSDPNLLFTGEIQPDSSNAQPDGGKRQDGREPSKPQSVTRQSFVGLFFGVLFGGLLFGLGSLLMYVRVRRL